VGAKLLAPDRVPYPKIVLGALPENILDLIRDSLLQGFILDVRHAAQHFEQSSLFAVEVGGDDDLDGDVKVPLAAPVDTDPG
jgi:hypothetical protein